MIDLKASEETTERALEPSELWVDLYGDYLYRQALLRLRDPVRAEDAVQETFLAALKACRSFAGRSNPRSWLLGILKNKIGDHFRRAGRESSFTDLGFFSAEESEAFVARGLSQGSWGRESGPRAWPEPGVALDNEDFWKAFQGCARKLPRKVAAAFALRELDGLETQEICAQLGVSEANLWVMLHRARMALRRCLETSWFSKA